MRKFVCALTVALFGFYGVGTAAGGHRCKDGSCNLRSAPVVAVCSAPVSGCVKTAPVVACSAPVVCAAPACNVKVKKVKEKAKNCGCTAPVAACSTKCEGRKLFGKLFSKKNKDCC